MSKYAEGTTVAASRSLEEIKSTLIRFGADRDTFTYAEMGRRVALQFTVKTRVVRMEMTLPDYEAFAKDRYGRRRLEHVIQKDWEAECRRVWRTLAVLVKAKLAAIADGISTFEREFMADLLLPSGETVGRHVIEHLDEAMRTGAVPKLVPTLPDPSRVVSASATIALGDGR